MIIFILILLIFIILVFLEYNFESFNSNNNTDKPLKFIHITKNAGTYVEDTAKESNILFGRFHKEYGFWHRIFPSVDKQIKDKYKWFVVVRNPYDRILSEYYCEWGGIGKKNINHTKQEMNNYLINKINNRSESGDHYTEQYKYLDKNYDIKIIKFENLDDELKQLYKANNLNINLHKNKINTGNSKNKIKKFSKNDFSNELINLINKVYSNDFELFNYSKKN